MVTVSYLYSCKRFPKFLESGCSTTDEGYATWNINPTRLYIFICWCWKIFDCYLVYSRVTPKDNWQSTVMVSPRARQRTSWDKQFPEWLRNGPRRYWQPSNQSRTSGTLLHRRRRFIIRYPSLSTLFSSLGPLDRHSPYLRVGENLRGNLAPYSLYTILPPTTNLKLHLRPRI